jgi:hypothetical protein
MKKNLLAVKSFLLAVFLLVLSACGTVATPTQDSSTPETMNTSLETLAKLFAKAVTDVSVRQQIQGGIAKRFDGDTNILYKTLTATSELQAQGGGTNIRQSLASLQPGGSSLEGLVKVIPRLQVAMPAGFDTWNAESEIPLVGFVPVDTDDKTIQTIKAFDAEGNEHVLNARTLPSKPVILLSQNERTDAKGNVLAHFSSLTQSPSATSNLQAQACYRNVYVTDIRMRDDNEPWISGDPELMLIARSADGYLSYHGGFNDVNSENKWYYPWRFIGCTSTDVVFYWYEDDSGSLDITPSYKGVSLNVKISNGDDFMGAVRSPYVFFTDAGLNFWDLGDIMFYHN